MLVDELVLAPPPPALELAVLELLVVDAPPAELVVDDVAPLLELDELLVDDVDIAPPCPCTGANVNASPLSHANTSSGHAKSTNHAREIVFIILRPFRHRR